MGGTTGTDTGTGTGGQDVLPPISTPAGTPATLPNVAGPQSSANNPYAGYALPQQVAGGFTDAMGGFSDLANQGQGLGQAGLSNLQGAQGSFQGMAGMTPADIQARQLSNTNLSPYMNPYQRDIIDTTMNEMNFQHGMRQQGIDDQAAAQGAFGGDRMYVQKALADKYQGQNQAQSLAQMNTANFQNAQNMGQFDINQQSAADKANQAMRASMTAGGATGLGNLAQMGSTLGGQFQQAGYGGLGDMANMGFGFGQDMQKNDMIMGQYQQQLQQQMMDAIKAQYQGFAGQGVTGLEVLSGGNKLGQSAGGTTTGKTTNDPGALGYLSGILSLAGMA